MNQDTLKKLMNTTKSLNILYVEDHEDVRTQTFNMLDIFFNSVDVATNGEEGLELFKKSNKYKSSSYDLIATDIEMPFMDGLTMIENIRNLDKEIPILVFSAHSNTDYLIKGIDAGIDAYILKPYTSDDISKTLFNLIDMKKIAKPEVKSIELEGDFLWDLEDSLLYKNNVLIKLTKSETKIFDLFLSKKGSPLKTYDEIGLFVFDDITNAAKNIRNLMSRLKSKLEYELFEAIYGQGFKLKYKKIEKSN